MQATRGMRGLTAIRPLHDDTVWGTAALQHAVSWQHVDDEGFATVVTNMVGSKYWVLARQRRDKSNEDAQGDMASAAAFGHTLQPTSASKEIFEHEGLLLEPGSVL
jgi:hypothetical protein